jgi:hypothetical protein
MLTLSVFMPAVLSFAVTIFPASAVLGMAPVFALPFFIIGFSTPL